MAKSRAKVTLVGRDIIVEQSDSARDLHERSGFGSKDRSKRISFSPFEVLFLLEEDRLLAEDGNGNEMSFDGVLRRLRRGRRFWLPYVVFRDLRSKGYVIKTGLKFGSSFRVYEKGVKPGKAHAKWLCMVARENESVDWQGLAARNRVSHTSRKSLLLALVDDEDQITYWEMDWTRP